MYGVVRLGVSGERGSEAGTQRVEDPRRGHEQLAGRRRTAAVVTAAAARLAGDELAGGGVPGVEAGLEVGVVTAGGDEAEVDGRRPEPADVAHVADQLGDDLRLLAAPTGGVGEPRRHQRERQL